jgi:hypothetical protein
MASSLSFADVPQTPRGHLGIFFYEAVLHVIRHLGTRALSPGQDFASVFESFPFLQPYFDELRARQPEVFDWQQSLAWYREQRHSWEAAATVWLPLRALRETLDFSDDSLLALVLTGLVEEEPQFGSLFADLQQPIVQRRPSLNLAHDILIERSFHNIDAWSLLRPLLECGFLEALNREAPRSEWILRVPIPFWNALRGELSPHPLPHSQFHPHSSLAPISALVIPSPLRAQIEEIPGLLLSGKARSVVVRGLPGTERLAVAAAIAQSLSRALLELHSPPSSNEERLRLVGPLCTILNALPVFSADLGPGESFDLPVLPGYFGPSVLLIGPEGGVTGSSSDHSIVVNLRPESPEERLQILRQTLAHTPVSDLARIAQNFALPGRYLRRATVLAESYAALDRRSSVTCADIRQASRTINRQQLDSLATPLGEAGDWSHLVVRFPTQQSLRHLESRCRHREQLSSTIGDGLPGGLNRGVRALFEGPSGTGKTLAARILATSLGLDIYRVDVAAVINKFIGETEKNLSKVLTRAEDLDVVLLLDEGDSLMARRTDVKSANDRYANLETNYLLQRLETYSGIVIVTTNVGNSIDSAFRRRIDVVVKFHLPDAGERLRLWQVHLPPSHAVSPVDLERIALRYEMTGGQIRNAAVQAALLAIEDGDCPVATGHVRSAVLAEFRKAGAAVPVDEVRDSPAHDARISGFLSAIS